MEIIKGPGGSLYGAGTGGVVLLKSPATTRDQLQLSAIFGSYGLQRYHLSGEMHSRKATLRFQYAHQEADGFREQTGMSRDALHGDLTLKINSNHLFNYAVLHDLCMKHLAD